MNYGVDLGLGAGAGCLPGLPVLESCCNQAWRALLLSQQSGRLSPSLQAAWRGDWLTLTGDTSFFFPHTVYCNLIRTALWLGCFARSWLRFSQMVPVRLTQLSSSGLSSWADLRV